MRLPLLCLAAALPSALVADTLWNGSSGANWNVAANWSAGVPPNSQATTNNLIIGTPAVTNLVMNHNLGNDYDLYSLQVNSNATGQVVIGGNSIDLFAGGINLTGAGANLRLNAQFDVSAAHPWVVPAGRVLEAFDVDGTATATISGGGIVRLSGTADNATPVFVVNGTTTLELNKSTNTVRAINGTATAVTLNSGAVLRLVGSGNDQIGNDADMVLNAGATMDLNGRSETWDGFAGAGLLTNTSSTNATAVINQTGANSTFTGFISNGGSVLSLTKGTGGAVAYFNTPATGQLTYTGLTTITGGALALNQNAYADIMSNNRIVLNGGALESDGTRPNPVYTLGTGTGQVHFAGNGGFSARTSDAVVTLNDGSTLVWGATPGFVGSNFQLFLGSGQATRTTTLVNDLDLGANAGTLGTVRVLNGGGGPAGIEGRIQGIVSGMSGLYKQGNNAVELTGVLNNHEGGTFALAGAVAYAKAENINADGPLGLEYFQTLTSGNGNYGGSATYTGTGAIPASFYETLADWSQPKTVAIAAANASPVDFNLAPAGLRDDLHLGAVHGAAFNQDGVISPVGGVYRLGGGGGSLVLDTPGDLAAGNELVVRDGGLVVLNGAAQPLDGAITVNGGGIEFRGDGALVAGTADVTVNGAHNLAALNNSIGGYNGPSGVVLQNLKAGAVVMVKKDPLGTTLGARRLVLNGGVLTTRDNSTTAGVITVSNVVARLGYNQIAHQPANGATGALDQLNLVNLARGDGATVEFRSQNGTLGGTGDNGRIQITNLDDGDGLSAPMALVDGVIGGWAVASGSNSNNPRDFAAWTAANGVATLAFATGVQTTGGFLNNGLPTENWQVNSTVAGRNTVTNNVTVNTVTVERSIVLRPNASLTVDAGGMLFRGNPGGVFGVSGPTNSFITSSWNSGAAGAPNDLYLHTAADTGQDTRIQAPVADHGTNPVRLVKTGHGQLVIDQDNRFTGGILVNFGTLTADFRNTTSVIDGNNIVIRTGGVFSTGLQSNRTETVTGNVLIDGGTLRNGNTGGNTGNTVTYTGTITVGSLPNTQGIIEPTNGRRLVVAPSGALTGSGNLYKTGDNTLEIQTANTAGLTGNIHVNSGAIDTTGAGKLPHVNLYMNGGTLNVTTTSQRIRNLAGTGGTVSGTSGGTDRLTVDQAVDAAFHGTISNTGLVKQGPAHLYLSGTGDNGSGAVTVNEGTASLAKFSSHTVHAVGGGGVILTVNSNAVARLAGGFANTGASGVNDAPPFRRHGVTLTYGAPGYPANYVDQIYYQGDVLVTAGTLDLNGRSESFDGLSGNAGAVITNGGFTNAVLMTGHFNTGGTFNGSITDGPLAGVGLVKLGTAVLTLGGTNTFRGETIVEAGTLRLAGAGSLANTPALHVNGGATLDVSGVTAAPYELTSGQNLHGTGTVLGALAAGSGSTVHPGSGGPGTLATGGLSFRAGSTLRAELRTATNLCDRVSVTGDLDIAAGAVLDLVDLQAGSPTNGTRFALASYTGAWSGGEFRTPGGAPIPDDSLVTVGALAFRVNYNDTTDGVTTGQYLTLTVAPAATPYESWIDSFGVSGPDADGDADPDGDGEANLVEFALAGNPTNATANLRLASTTGTFTNDFLYTTVPVRIGAAFSGAPALASAPVDGIVYRVEGSENLALWQVPVSEHSPAITNSLPAAPAGWSYRTFRFTQPLADPRARGYLRVGAEPAP